jgi:RsiW-degrading membrane proteinase PrsW (M82 family)
MSSPFPGSTGSHPRRPEPPIREPRHLHHPMPVRRPASLMPVAWLGCGCLTLILTGLVVLILGSALGPEAFGPAMIMAAVPVPFYVGIALWLDRFEAEPPWLLLVSFIWGAVIAVFFSIICNDTFQAIAHEVWGPEVAGVATPVIAAPFFEETFKGLGLLLVFWWMREEFDNVVDGIIYASMIGLGFAMTENVLYYGRAFLEGGTQTAVILFGLRGVLSPFAHPFFTSMTGIGLGLARTWRNPFLGFLVAVVGWCLAVGLHFVWNLSGVYNLGVFFVVYIFIMVPIMAGLLLLMLFSLMGEGATVRQYLAGEVQQGNISARELDCLSRFTSRMGACMRALFTGGPLRWWRRIRFHQAASELAFHRRRLVNGVIASDALAAEREAAYVKAVAEYYRSCGEA